MDKTKKYKFSLLCLFLVGFLGIIFLYVSFIDEIILSFKYYQEAILFLIVTVSKIGIASVCGFYLIIKWFRQEELYLSDIPFLTGIFFLILILAKMIDLLVIYTIKNISNQMVLFLLKIRYILMILNLLPMMYLSVGMFLFYLSLKKRYKKLENRNTLINYQKIILIGITILELITILSSPSFSMILNTLPFLVIPSLVMIVWVFAFAYKNNQLSQINPLIVSVGFLVYLLTTFFRSIGQYFLSEIIHTALSEIFEILSFCIIFSGLISKKKRIVKIPDEEEILISDKIN